ncbi:MAG: hypothetical protein AAB460_00115 [Patescibacteria group bacterium]
MANIKDEALWDILKWVGGWFAGSLFGRNPFATSTTKTTSAGTTPATDTTVAERKERKAAVAAFWAKVARGPQQNFLDAKRRLSRRNRDRLEVAIAEMLNEFKSGLVGPGETEEIYRETKKADTIKKVTIKRGHDRSGWNRLRIFVDAFNRGCATPTLANEYADMLLQRSALDAARSAGLWALGGAIVYLVATLIFVYWWVRPAIMKVVSDPSGASDLFWAIILLGIGAVLLAPVGVSALALLGPQNAPRRYLKVVWWALTAMIVFGFWALLPADMISTGTRTLVSFIMLAIITVVFMAGIEGRGLRILAVVLTVTIVLSVLIGTGMWKKIGEKTAGWDFWPFGHKAEAVQTAPVGRPLDEFPDTILVRLASRHLSEPVQLEPPEGATHWNSYRFKVTSGCVFVLANGGHNLGEACSDVDITFNVDERLGKYAPAKKLRFEESRGRDAEVKVNIWRATGPIPVT